MEQKIKQTDIFIGKNIRKIRLSKGIHQTELVRMLQLQNINITRESLVKSNVEFNTSQPRNFVVFGIV